MPVTYQELKGRRVTQDEAAMVEILRNEAALYVDAATDLRNVNRRDIPDAMLVRRCMRMHEIMLPDAIAMLLCEDIGPDHALIERIEAMRIVIEDLDSPRGVLRGSTKSHVAGLVDAFHSERRDSDRLVKADFAQAWTKYIQGQPAPIRRDAEAAVASWMVSGKPVRFDAERAEMSA